MLAQIRALAQRARIALPRPATSDSSRQPAAVPVPYGLTGRELAVLWLLAAGRTNAQIGAELYICPKTASVHVTSICASSAPPTGYRPLPWLNALA